MLLFVVVLAPTTENQFEQLNNYGSGGLGGGGGGGGWNPPQLWNLLRGEYCQTGSRFLKIHTFMHEPPMDLVKVSKCSS